MEKIKIQCVNLKFNAVTGEFPYSQDYKDLLGVPMLAYNFAQHKVFTLGRYLRPDNTGDTILITLIGTDDKDTIAKVEMTECISSSVIYTAILPACFHADSKFSNFEIGQEVVTTGAIHINSDSGEHAISQRWYSSMNVEFAKVVLIKENSIKVELLDIPGQKETITNPILISSKLEVIPFLI